MKTLGVSALHHMANFLEEWIGYDSIDTIERVYDRAESGAIACCWPECSTRHHDPVALWKHVHFTRHGDSFGYHKPEQVWRALQEAGWPQDIDRVASLTGGAPVR